jgi:HEAT repeat protein
MRGVVHVFCPRSFQLVRKGLADPAPAVAEDALRALRQFSFLDGLDSLTRIFRESTDERVRLAALESISKIHTPDAAMVLLEAARQETGTVRQVAESRLGTFGGEEVATLLREACDLELGDRRDLFERLLRAVG